MEFTHDDFTNLERLSRLKFADSEREKIYNDIKSVLEYVAQVVNVDLPVKGDKHYDIKNITKADVTSPENAENKKLIKSNFPNKDGDYAKVSQVIKK